MEILLIFFLLKTWTAHRSSRLLQIQQGKADINNPVCLLADFIQSSFIGRKKGPEILGQGGVKAKQVF
jgi:hypothetical protein